MEAIREYAAEHLAAHEDEVAVRERHAAYFLAVAEAARPELAKPAVRSWLDRLETEHGNLRAALDWLEHAGHGLDALRLASALAPFWDYHGHLTEGRVRLERALDPGRTEDAPPALVAEASAWLGFLALRQGAFDVAEARLEAARAIRDRHGDTAGVARATQMLGSVAEYRGNDALAQARYETALTLVRAIGDLSGLGGTLDNLADAAYRRGDFEQAAALAREAVGAGRAVGPAVRVATALVSLGQAARALGDGNRAVEALRESLDLSLDLGYHLGVAEALVGVADVAAAAGDAARAARLLAAAGALADRLGVALLPHHALHRRALAAAQAGLSADAFAAAQAAGRGLPLEEVLTEARAVSGVSLAEATGTFTPREREILRLLVAGHTDRAIGETLFIGTRTVESHVARIYAKLGVRNRAAATAGALAARVVDPPPPPAAPKEQ